jgi:tetratricopeptide (TPR) repeat protein
MFLRFAAVAGLLVCSQALPALAQAPADRPDEIERVLAQAADMHQAGDLLGAVEAYRVVLQTSPERADVRSNLGAAYVKLGRFDDGMEQYREAIRLDPGNATYRFNLALAYYKAVRPSEAIPEFREVLRLEPAHRAATLLLADCQFQTGDDAAVVATLAPHESAFADDLAYAYLYGMSLVRTGEQERGQVFVDRIFKAGESAEGHLLMGVAYMTASDFKSAIGAFEKAIALNPSLPRAYSFYGRALLSSGDSAAATRQFLKALEHNPNDFDANLQMGGIRQRDQRFDEALTYLGRASAVRSTDLAVRHTTASVYLAQGQADKALPLLEAVVKEAPEYIDARVLLATTYYRLKRREDGDRERQVAARLTAEAQARQPGARQAEPAGETPLPVRPQGPTR